MIPLQDEAAALRTESARKDAEIGMLRRKFARMSETLTALRDESIYHLRKKDDIIEELELQLLSSSCGTGSSGSRSADSVTPGVLCGVPRGLSLALGDDERNSEVGALVLSGTGGARVRSANDPKEKAGDEWAGEDLQEEVCKSSTELFGDDLESGRAGAQDDLRIGEGLEGEVQRLREEFRIKSEECACLETALEELQKRCIALEDEVASTLQQHDSMAEEIKR